MTRIDIRIETGRSAHLILAASWPQWYYTTPSAPPHLSPAWILGWSTLRPHHDQAVITAKTGGHLLAAMPLVVRDNAATSATPYGPLHLVGPAATDSRVVRALLLGAARAWPTLTIETVPLVSVMTPLLDAMGGWRRQSLTSVPTIPLIGRPAAGTSPTACLWADHAAAGRATYSRSTSRAELVRATAELLALRRATGAIDTGAWSTMLRYLGPQIATTAVLRLDGQPVAARLLLYRGRHLYSVLSAGHPRPHAAARAPGEQLLRALVQDLAGIPGYRSLALWDPASANRGAGMASAHEPVWQTTVTYTRNGTPPPPPRPATAGTPAEHQAANPSPSWPGQA
jgi:Acetyltransferase (GNAT) domain